MEDIKDNEIRIIGQDKAITSASMQKESPLQSENSSDKRKRRRDKWLGAILLILSLVTLPLVYRALWASDETEQLAGNDEQEALFDPEPEVESVYEENVSSSTTSAVIEAFAIDTTAFVGKSYCEILRDTVNDIPLRILIPVNAKPEFRLGLLDEKKDNSIILALQAADIRKDNGEIVGASVCKGEVVGKGLAKKGFVSIIDGEITIGVSERSSLFEEAVQRAGDFFRQYPLVFEGRLVENNPKNKSIRRALCERAEQIIVIESETAESFHDFSQALVDFKVRNAVYLVGSQYACGFLRDSSGNTETWGEARFVRGKRAKNVSYIIWR